MANKTDTLITHWREGGPVEWAEGAYGWVGPEHHPITLEPWQRAALMAWWEHRETCTTLAISNVKKTGKTFSNAVLLAWRWLALPGEHYAVGNDLDQAAGRQFQQIAEMVKRNVYLKANCRVTVRVIEFIPTGSTIMAIPVDAAGNAGANHLTASHTETWGVIYEAGIRAYEELTPPPGRLYGLPALRIADSYAGFEGESQTWHNLVDRGLTGERVSADWPIFRAGGLILFHMAGREAQERCFRGEPAEAAVYYKDQSDTLRAGTFRRQHENERSNSESEFIQAGTWESCYDPDLRALLPGDKRRIVLGADASTSRDFTALVGVVWDTERKVSEVVYVRVWKPKVNILRFGKLTVDLDETIKPEILRLHRGTGGVVCYFDPYQLHSISMSLQKAGVKMVELPQTSMRVEADQALYDAIISHSIRHYNDPTLNEHVKNAVAIETPRGFRLAKERTSRKIDAAVALSMAHYGARKYPGRKPEAFQTDGMGHVLTPNRPDLTGVPSITITSINRGEDAEDNPNWLWGKR